MYRWIEIEPKSELLQKNSKCKAGEPKKDLANFYKLNILKLISNYKNCIYSLRIYPEIF